MIVSETTGIGIGASVVLGRISSLKSNLVGYQGLTFVSPGVMEYRVLDQPCIDSD